MNKKPQQPSGGNGNQADVGANHNFLRDDSKRLPPVEQSSSDKNHPRAQPKAHRSGGHHSQNNNFGSQTTDDEKDSVSAVVPAVVPRPSNAPNARQQGSGMLSDHDFDALFAAVDMDPDASELSPNQRLQEVFRQAQQAQGNSYNTGNTTHSNTGSSVASVMSVAMATGADNVPQVLQTTTTSLADDAPPAHHTGSHGNHHHRHKMSVEDISPSQTQQIKAPAASGNGTGNDGSASAAVVSNVQGLKKKAGKGPRVHRDNSVSRNSNGNNPVPAAAAAAAADDNAADKDWSTELDNA